jgi:hypothetical protein
MLNQGGVMRRKSARLCTLGRAAAITAVVLSVGVATVGVSIPAGGASEREEKSDRKPHEATERMRRSRGERGHIRRRNDLIGKKSHVDKKRGWRKIE